MAWRKKEKETTRTDNVKKPDEGIIVDERIQRYPDTDEGRVARAVAKTKLPDEPVALGGQESEQEQELNEIDPEKWYVLKVPVSGKMILRMQDMGPKLGYVDEAEVFRDGFRRVLWGK